ncbi:MAG: GAF domain-containing protein [Deltaproteobacteria bacterium]|nr:GAF domain-containing protein [Deltaproteobacteria bacterium]
MHGRGEPRLDGVVDFVAFAARALALTAFLDEAPTRIAEIFGAPVCSLYLLEPAAGDEPVDDPAAAPHELVMRGNVGFPAMALGAVRLGVGEGITGMAVALGRPISVAEAEHHRAYRHFAQLGEERYPVFLGAPIMGPEGPLGAIIVQREVGRPFEGRDVELLVALSASLAHGILRADLLDQLRGQAITRGPGGGTRRVTLTGKPVVPGRALGAISALRRPASRPREAAVAEEVGSLRTAFEVASRAVEQLGKQAVELGLGDEADFLQTYAQILDDRRFLERALELVELKRSIGGGMAEVAREATRAARLTGDAFSERRARDIEDLCDAITMLAAGDPRAELPSKAVLVGDRLTVYDLLVTAKARPSAIALGEAGSGERTRSLAALLGVPCVTAVQGLFRWAADGDVALVDGDHGLVVLNPSKADVQRVRSAR